MTRSPPRRMPETSMQKTTLPQAGDRVAVGSRLGRGGQQLGRAPPKNWQLAAIVVALFALPWLSAITLIGWLLPQGLAPWVLALPIVLYGTGLFLLTIAAGVTSIATTSLSIGTRGRLSLAR